MKVWSGTESWPLQRCLIIALIGPGMLWLKNSCWCFYVSGRGESLFIQPLTDLGWYRCQHLITARYGTISTLCLPGQGKRLESCAKAFHCLRPEVTHDTSSHSPLARTSYGALPNCRYGRVCVYRRILSEDCCVFYIYTHMWVCNTCLFCF